MTAAQLAGSLGAPGLSIVSLQKDATPEELRAFGANLFDAGPELADFNETAALIANLDLVITVDTSICHLAGALGVSVWTLVDAYGDWRWMLGRADSPWYPTMRLFRQQTLGDWAPPLDEVRQSLAAG